MMDMHSSSLRAVTDRPGTVRLAIDSCANMLALDMRAFVVEALIGGAVRF